MLNVLLGNLHHLPSTSMCENKKKLHHLSAVKEWLLIYLLDFFMEWGGSAIKFNCSIFGGLWAWEYMYSFTYFFLATDKNDLQSIFELLPVFENRSREKWKHKKSRKSRYLKKVRTILYFKNFRI